MVNDNSGAQISSIDMRKQKAPVKSLTMTDLKSNLQHQLDVTNSRGNNGCLIDQSNNSSNPTVNSRFSISSLLSTTNNFNLSFEQSLIHLHKFFKEKNVYSDMNNDYKRRTIILKRLPNKFARHNSSDSLILFSSNSHKANKYQQQKLNNTSGEFGFNMQSYGLFNALTQQTEYICFVNNVEPQSPAKKAGLNNGDVILAIDNIRTDEFRTFTDIVRHVKGKLELRLVILSEITCRRIRMQQRVEHLKKHLIKKQRDLEFIRKQKELILSKYNLVLSSDTKAKQREEVRLESDQFHINESISSSFSPSYVKNSPNGLAEHDQDGNDEIKPVILLTPPSSLQQAPLQNTDAHSSSIISSLTYSSTSSSSASSSSSYISKVNKNKSNLVKNSTPNCNDDLHLKSALDVVAQQQQQQQQQQQLARSHFEISNSSSNESKIIKENLTLSDSAIEKSPTILEYEDDSYNQNEDENDSNYKVCENNLSIFLRSPSTYSTASLPKNVPPTKSSCNQKHGLNTSSSYYDYSNLNDSAFSSSFLPLNSSTNAADSTNSTANKMLKSNESFGSHRKHEVSSGNVLEPRQNIVKVLSTNPLVASNDNSRTALIANRSSSLFASDRLPNKSSMTESMFSPSTCKKSLFNKINLSDNQLNYKLIKAKLSSAISNTSSNMENRKPVVQVKDDQIKFNPCKSRIPKSDEKSKWLSRTFDFGHSAKTNQDEQHAKFSQKDLNRSMYASVCVPGNSSCLSDESPFFVNKHSFQRSNNIFRHQASTNTNNSNFQRSNSMFNPRYPFARVISNGGNSSICSINVNNFRNSNSDVLIQRASDAETSLKEYFKMQKLEAQMKQTGTCDAFMSKNSDHIETNSQSVNLIQNSSNEFLVTRM